MSGKSIVTTLASNPIGLAVGAVLVIGVVYYLVKKTAGDVAKGAGGLVSGNNVITANQHNWDGEATDAYVNKGVAGTVGGAFNSASGGAFASIGEWLGGKIADWTDDYDPNSGLYTGAKIVAQGAANTDALWGKTGSTVLRAN